MSASMSAFESAEIQTYQGLFQDGSACLATTMSGFEAADWNRRGIVLAERTRSINLRGEPRTQPVVEIFRVGRDAIQVRSMS